jgi:hypothetical protein
MKLLTLFLIVLSGSVYSQTLKERIQGDWVCVGIWDSKGQPTKGKFGESNEYLKFSFKKNKLSITETPFDTDSAMDVTFKDEKIINLLPTAVYEFPERIYEVRELTDDLMTLTTKGQNRKPITYKFLNQIIFAEDIENKIIDLGILIITKMDARIVNQVFGHRVSNVLVFPGPSPTFKYPGGDSFGDIFSLKMKWPKNFKFDELTKFTNEMTVDFDVSAAGASNIKIVNGLSPELDMEVARVMDKLRKRWKPVVINDKPVKTTSRFHMYFYMSKFILEF